MALRLYLDHNVPNVICEGLRMRGVDVLTAFEDEAHRLSDPELLDRASEVGRVLFSMDQDFLVEAAERQRSGQLFPGVIYAHQQGCPIGQCIEDLELIAKAADPEDFVGWVQYLPI